SAGTIAKLDRNAEIILMDREPNFVARFLEAHDFRFAKVHLVPPRTPTKIGAGLVVDMVTADPAHELNYMIDSGLVLDWGGFKIYNANDCPPYPDGLDYINRTYGRLDLALLPYAGGSGYPPCYTNLTHGEKVAEKERIMAAGFEMFRSAADALKPRYVMPFADQYVVAGSRSHLNTYVAHPPSPGAVAPKYGAWGLQSELLLLNTSQTFDFETGRRAPPDRFQDHDEAARDRYVREHLASSRYEHESLTSNRAPPLAALVKAARHRLWQAQVREGWYPPETWYVSATEGPRFRIDMQADKVEVMARGDERSAPCLSMTAPANLLVLLLSGYASWNIADAALLVDYHREPNVYHPQAYVMLNYLRV
ncbi:MAG: hypothetical protein ACYDBQ_00930, partial [Thermoplasmatota archaeon]